MTSWIDHAEKAESGLFILKQISSILKSHKMWEYIPWIEIVIVTYGQGESEKCENLQFTFITISNGNGGTHLLHNFKATIILGSISNYQYQLPKSLHMKAGRWRLTVSPPIPW